MRVFAVYCILGCCTPALVHGKDFNLTAVSGQLTKMENYISWSDDCASKSGTVKVLAKPQHGTLSTRIVDSKIGLHHRIPRVTYCTGVPVKALQVTYTSVRGFHGTDNFSLEAIWSTHRDIDNYTVTVK